jgi:mono/diheme cytochrome c family protein
MKFSCVAWLAAGLLVACTSEERDPSQWPLSKRELEQKSAPAAPGEATYRRYCIGCHGVDGRANGGITGADFVSQKTLLSAKPDADLALSVREGKRGARGVMPAHKPVLSDAQIEEVIGYVRKRFFQDAPNSP